jgi:hypothetical protein
MSLLLLLFFFLISKNKDSIFTEGQNDKKDLDNKKRGESMKTLLPSIMLGTCFLRFGAAFVGRTSTSKSSIGSRRIVSFTRQGKTLVSLRAAAAEEPSTTTSSYDIDTDEDVEQRLGENAVVLKPIQTNGGGGGGGFEGSNGGGEGRYDDLLASVGLQNKLRHVGDLPEKRAVSVYDIFCNRELALGGINAIGFDMDYVSYTQQCIL